jgi:hypothetical protein
MGNYQINTITVPEGDINFVTAVVREVNPMFGVDRIIPGNVVVGSTFTPNWSSVSQELTDFEDTVLEWCSSVTTMADELSEYGYYLMEEGDELLTEQVISYLHK